MPAKKLEHEFSTKFNFSCAIVTDNKGCMLKGKSRRDIKVKKMLRYFMGKVDHGDLTVKVSGGNYDINKQKIVDHDTGYYVRKYEFKSVPI